MGEVARTRRVRVPNGAWVLVALALVAAALVSEALLRTRLVSNDSFGYVNVARNVALGRGLTQSALGYNAARFPSEADWPAPFTAQAPLYPLLVALPIRMGLDPAASGLLVSALALVAIWAFGYGLAREWLGPSAGLAALTVLVLAAAFPGVTARAWSETTAIAFVLLWLWLLLRALRVARDLDEVPVEVVLAGLAAGLAFATRYLLAVALPVGIFAALASRAGHPGRIARSFTAAWTAVALPVVARNLALTGSVLGAERNPTTTWAGTSSLLEATRGPRGAAALIALVVFALALPFVEGWLRRRTLRAAERAAREPMMPSPTDRVEPRPAISGELPARFEWRAATSTPRAMPAPHVTRSPRQDGDLSGGAIATWIVAYVVSLVALRMLFAFDDLGLRLLSPAVLPAAVAFAALLGRALAPRPERLALPVAAIALVCAVVVTVRLARAAPVPPSQRIERSARLRWVRDHTDPHDLLIGDDAMDLPVYFAGGDGAPRSVASFSPRPYMQPVVRDSLLRFADRQRGRWKERYLILRKRDADSSEWERLYGPFIARLAAGRPDPAFRLVADLEDARVFRIER